MTNTDPNPWNDPPPAFGAWLLTGLGVWCVIGLIGWAVVW